MQAWAPACTPPAGSGLPPQAPSAPPKTVRVAGSAHRDVGAVGARSARERLEDASGELDRGVCGDAHRVSGPVRPQHTSAWHRPTCYRRALLLRRCCSGGTAGGAAHDMSSQAQPPLAAAPPDAPAAYCAEKHVFACTAAHAGSPLSRMRSSLVQASHAGIHTN